MVVVVVFTIVVVVAFVIIIKEIINSMIYIIPSYIVLMQSDLHTNRNKLAVSEYSATHTASQPPASHETISICPHASSRSPR